MTTPRISALCSDSKFRAVTFHRGFHADTFFSIPAQVRVNSKTVTGFITQDNDPGVNCWKFTADGWRKNSRLLPDWPTNTN